MKEAIRQIKEFNDERDWHQFHTAENIAKSIVIEASELLECFQWSDDYKREDVLDELADVLNYCILMADLLDVDMEEIVLEKLKKNRLKYPAELARGNAKKYTEY